MTPNPKQSCLCSAKFNPGLAELLRSAEPDVRGASLEFGCNLGSSDDSQEQHLDSSDDSQEQHLNSSGDSEEQHLYTCEDEAFRPMA